MKKIALLLIVPILLGGCLKNDEEKFPQSAAERMQARIAEAYDVLTSATNGWVMEYYPEKDRIYGGYNLFVKFSKNNEITASSENFDASETSTSLYSIKADNGPVLRFDTYNDILHFYSSPSTGARLGVGTKDGGLNGDQEFTIMEVRSDYVRLMGKKTGNTITLTPLPADADWQTEMVKYQNAPKEMDFMTYRYVDTETSVDLPISVKATINNFTSRVFTITYPKDPKKEDSEKITITAPFVYTLTGFKFHEPLVIYDKSVSEMVFTDDYYFADKAGGTVTIMTPEPIHSDLTVAVSVPSSSLTYNSAVSTLTPSKKDEYYYYMIYEKVLNDGISDKKIIKEIITNLNSAGNTPEDIMKNYCGKGNVNKTWTNLYEKTTYVIAAFGCSASKDGKSVVSTTALFKQEFTTPDVPASTSADYCAWLGTYKVVSASSVASNKPLTMNVRIAAKEAGKTFNVVGWTSSVVTEPVVGTYSTASKTIAVKDNQVIENLSDSDGQCLYVPYAKTPTGGWTILSGGWNIAITFALNSDKSSVNVTMPSVQSGGKTYSVVTFEFFYYSGGKFYLFDPAPGFSSGDLPVAPYTMNKVTKSPAAIYKENSTFVYYPGVVATPNDQYNNLAEVPHIDYK